MTDRTEWSSIIKTLGDIKKLTNTDWYYNPTNNGTFVLSHKDYGSHEFSNYAQLRAFLDRWYS